MTIFRLLLLSFLLCFQFHINAQSNERYFPPFGQWASKAPSDFNVDSDLLQAAIQFAIDNETQAPRDLEKNHYSKGFGTEPYGDGVGPFKQRGAPTGLIIKNGYIIGEWGTPGRVDMTFSVTKSFLSSTVGIAYDKGLIALDNEVYKDMGPVVPFEPHNMGTNKIAGWDTPHVLPLFETDHNKSITWENLLRQTSDWEGTLWGKPDWADRPEGKGMEWIERKRNIPGSVYKYNDVRVNLLALAIMNVLRESPAKVLRENVMDPIGASRTWRWHGYENSWVVLDGMPMQALSGGGHWGGGMFINAYDQARLGYLTLNKGQWKSDQILSKKWIDAALTPTKAKSTYGFMNFFLNTDQELYPSAPASAFAHLGAGTNMVYVDSENDLIIVARWIDRNALDTLIGKVLSAVE